MRNPQQINIPFNIIIHWQKFTKLQPMKPWHPKILLINYLVLNKC
jgi:hypothetical protein